MGTGGEYGVVSLRLADGGFQTPLVHGAEPHFLMLFRAGGGGPAHESGLARAQPRLCIPALLQRGVRTAGQDHARRIQVRGVGEERGPGRRVGGTWGVWRGCRPDRMAHDHGGEGARKSHAPCGQRDPGTCRLRCEVVFWVRCRLGDRRINVDYAEPAQKVGASAGARNVFVGNLPADVTEDAVRAAFEEYGEIERIHMPRPGDGEERRFGFVHFVDRSAALRAVEDPAPPILGDRRLNVRARGVGGGLGEGREAVWWADDREWRAAVQSGGPMGGTGPPLRAVGRMAHGLGGRWHA